MILIMILLVSGRRVVREWCAVMGGPRRMSSALLLPFALLSLPPTEAANTTTYRVSTIIQVISKCAVMSHGTCREMHVSWYIEQNYRPTTHVECNTTALRSAVAAINTDRTTYHVNLDLNNLTNKLLQNVSIKKLFKYRLEFISVFTCQFETIICYYIIIDTDYTK